MRLTSATRVLGAALAVAAYALPPATSALADLSHGAFHLYETLEAHHAEAAALGLVHLHDASRGPVRTPAAPGGSAHVHEHGGTPHSHAAAVDLLIAASDDVDEEREHTASTLVELANHLPGQALVLDVREPRLLALDAHAARFTSDRTLQPPLPPPRA